MINTNFKVGDKVTIMYQPEGLPPHFTFKPGEELVVEGGPSLEDDESVFCKSLVTGNCAAVKKARLNFIGLPEKIEKPFMFPLWATGKFYALYNKQIVEDIKPLAEDNYAIKQEGNWFIRKANRLTMKAKYGPKTAYIALYPDKLGSSEMPIPDRAGAIGQMKVTYTENKILSVEII